MPYDPNYVMIAADDAEALGGLLFDATTHTRARGPIGERLAEKLLAAQIVPTAALPVDVVRLGAAVTYAELPAGRQRTVRIVTPPLADANEGRVSVLSPIGSALLGQPVGAVLDVDLPSGRPLPVRVEAIEHLPAVAPTN